jgi:large subunit ribosomal protein L7/L12
MSQRVWSPDVAATGDRIATLTLAEAVALRSYLEQAHGIRPASAASAVRPVRPDMFIEEPSAEPTEFDVLLDGFDAAQRVATIKVVREATGLGLKEARDLVEGAPKAVKQRLPKVEADTLKARLEAAGAKVSLRACAP